jgi:integrase
MPRTSSTLVANNYIYVSFRCDDDRLRYPTGVKDSNSLGKSESKKIEKIKGLIDNYSLQYELLGQPVKKAELESYLDRLVKPDKVKKKSDRDFVSDHKRMIQAMRDGTLLKKKSKKKYSPASIDQYQRMRERWEECAADPTSGFLLSYDMTIEIFRKLLVWLIKKNYSQNSIYNIVNNLEIFLRYAYNEGYHANKIYEHREFAVPQEESDAIAPTYDEVITLYNTPFKRKSEEQARDLFVYGCFLALRVKDLNRINEYKLIGNVYELSTQKTGKKVIIPCHWIGREIYNKYNGIIPTFLRQTFSRILPRICKAAGITGEKLITMTVGGEKIEKYYKRWDLISPHSMRRFYATWMYRDLRRQPREIMAITGHESEESFFKYIKIELEMNAHEIANDPAFKKPV